MEKRTVVEFHTFPAFRFLGVKCWTNEDKELKLSPGSDASRGLCDPLNRVELIFSAPIIKEALAGRLATDPDLAGGRTDFDPWANVYTWSRLRSPHKKNYEYSIRLPTLKAFETYHLKAEGKELKDEFGRALPGDIDFKFSTDHRRPNFNLDGPFFVLEKGVDSEVPLVVTNLKEIEYLYTTLTPTKRSATIRRTFKIDKAEDISYRMPLPTRELIEVVSGVVQGSFETEPQVRNKGDYDRWFFSQVTPYNVHVKLGHFNTVVWVTDLATGDPVEGVAVDIYTDNFGIFKADPASLTKAVTNAGGVAVLSGTEIIDPNLDFTSSWWRNSSEKLFVRCVKGSDMALVPLLYPFEVTARTANDGYVNNRLQRRYGHIHTWGTTAQGVYKAGDTVEFKFYVRNQTNKVFVPPPLKGYTLKIVDPMGKVVHKKEDLWLSAFGAYDGEFIVPKSGAVGWYRFELTADFKKHGVWTPMRVLVSDFTPAPFRVTTDLNGELFKSGDRVQVLTSAKLHSGGPYVDALARVTARLKERAFRPKAAKAGGFYFDTYQKRYYGTRTINETKGSIDNKGELQSEFTIKEAPVLYGRLIVESAVRDDRGKYVARQASAGFVGRDRFVGIKQGDWVLKQGQAAKVDFIVVDEQGQVAPGTVIKFTVEYRETTASSVKGSGNAYLTHYTHKWILVAECESVSRADGVSCEFTPDKAGPYRMKAAILDTLGREHSSKLTRWAAGKGRVLWETSPDNTLSVFPEKDEYKIGETARYLVQNPYPGAKALITIERYGVLKSWVETFADSTEVVEFPVLPDYMPGFFLSVVVMSPRQGQPEEQSEDKSEEQLQEPSEDQLQEQPEKQTEEQAQEQTEEQAQEQTEEQAKELAEKLFNETGVDLGKPAFRMGYVRTPVVDPYKEIIVKVTPEKDTYRPRDKVKVGINASVRSPFTLPEQPKMELAVAVLDESVFDLLSGGRSYFDPYKGFYYLDPLDMENFSLLKQLVGRQKFEKKGASAGGDGGMDLNLRSLFKFVSYWNPSIKTDKSGNADIEFDLPDNLTGWMVLAMAVTDADRMGLGDASFAVNLPTEIRPALPNQVTEGDSFSAGFTIMNRTEKTRTLSVFMRAEGSIDSDAPISFEEKIIAEPYKRYLVWLPVKTRPVKTKEGGEVLFTITAGDEFDRDAIKKTVPVLKRATLLAAATYGTTVSGEVTERIAFPEDMRTDVGRVSVVASPTVIGNLESAFKYMRDYPYMCWEQKLTKGVMAAHYINLKHYLPRTLRWKESEGLPEATLRLAAEHQAPNGGMTYYTPSDKYASPYLSAYTAIAFNWLRQSGYTVPEDVEKKLHGYLLNMLRRDTMPEFYSKGMASTVRAVALAALAPRAKLIFSDLKRHESHLMEMSLFGKAHYLMALLNMRGTEVIQKKVVDNILSHANQTGGKFIFSEAVDSTGYERILATPLRANCATLSALLQYSESTPGAAETAADIPFKLVRTITQSRGDRARWENTQENMFCMNSLVDFSRVYESDEPDMTVKAWFETEPMGQTRFTDFRVEAVDFERPVKKGDAGRKATVKLEREGVGRVYYGARLFYAPRELKKDAINSGIEVRREYSVERGGEWTPLGQEMEIKTGELVLVDIYLSLPSARNFVVVDDPVPGGLEPVNRDLATASTVDADKGEFKRCDCSYWFSRDDWVSYGYSRWSFYHKELRHHAARFYSEYLPAGNYHLSYTAQAIAPGEFTVMPLHAEEMYDPDVFGKGKPASLGVERAE